MDGVNWWGVIVAAVAGFAFGAAWYMTLSKQWVAALGRSAEEVKGSSWRLVFPIAALAQLVLAYVLSCAVTWRGVTDVGGAMTTAFIVWLGFVLTLMAVNYGFQGAKPRLLAIDAGHWLGVLLLQALVIGLFAG